MPPFLFCGPSQSLTSLAKLTGSRPPKWTRLARDRAGFEERKPRAFTFGRKVQQVRARSISSRYSSLMASSQNTRLPSSEWAAILATRASTCQPRLPTKTRFTSVRSSYRRSKASRNRLVLAFGRLRACGRNASIERFQSGPKRRRSAPGLRVDHAQRIRPQALSVPSGARPNGLPAAGACLTLRLADHVWDRPSS